MVVNSLILLWATLLPGWFFFFVGRMRRPIPAPACRTCAWPSSSPRHRRSPGRSSCTTLEAMLRQRFPDAYDAWLADEDPDAETLAWCDANGVRVSSRDGVAAYHRAELAAAHALEGGQPRLLLRPLGLSRATTSSPSSTPITSHARLSRARSSAPSPIRASATSPRRASATRNRRRESGPSARASTWRRRSTAPLQAGGYTTRSRRSCIGSHYAVRTQALQEIGGVGPELAEDFSTTTHDAQRIRLGAASSRFDAEAHGDGADSFADSSCRNSSGARSLSQRHARSHAPLLAGLGARGKRIKFGFAQVWYPLYALQMLVAIAPPAGGAPAVRSPWVRVRSGRLLRTRASSLVDARLLATTVVGPPPGLAAAGRPAAAQLGDDAVPVRPLALGILWR